MISAEDDTWDPTEPTLPELMEDYPTWVRVFGIERCVERMAWILSEAVERTSGAWRMNMETYKAEHPRIPQNMDDQLMRMSHACQDAYQLGDAIWPSIQDQGLLGYGRSDTLIVPGPAIDGHGMPRFEVHDDPVYVTGGILRGTPESFPIAVFFSILHIDDDAIDCPVCRVLYEKNDGPPSCAEELLARIPFSEHGHTHACGVRPGFDWPVGIERFHIFNDKNIKMDMNIQCISESQEIFRKLTESTPGLIYIPVWTSIFGDYSINNSVKGREIHNFLNARDDVIGHRLSDRGVYRKNPFATSENVAEWRDRLGIHGPFRRSGT